jgi:Tol biopolymer transport system component
MTVRRISSLLALLGLLALAGCTTGTPPQTSSSSPTPTTAPASKLELTFLGSDGNVWEMAWPSGVPKQLTTDAQANHITYSGLAWSPDASKLAVLRETGPQTNPTDDALILLSPDGQSLGKYSLISRPYNTPFAWSPDGTLIAYRTQTDRVDFATNNVLGRLTIIDAQTGNQKQTLLYENGGGGCGGAGFSPLKVAVDAAHNAYEGLDTFTWSPDQQSILVSNGCGNNGAGLVDLGTGNTNAVYPAGASYQPGGSGMLVGDWYGNNTTTLGLANANGAEHSTLTSETPSNTSPAYNTVIGLAAWSPDGQTVYYEHDNDIWSVGADGSNAHKIIAGAAPDSQQQATVQLLPSVSPDGSLLLYLQAQGSNASGIDNPSGPATLQCYVARADGSQATALPQGASSAVWRPVK